MCCMDFSVNYHSSIKIANNIYVDPFRIDVGSKNAKYIFITHSHYDHYSIEDINKVVNSNSIFICPKDVGENLKKIYPNKVVVVEPNSSYEVEKIKFDVFASYNVNKKFHPKENKWVGYNIEIGNCKYAVLGDSDLTEEVKSIQCDVLFVPIGGTYTMNAKEAALLTNIIKPKIVVPVHYNGIVGNKNDENEFLENLGKEIKFKICL